MVSPVGASQPPQTSAMPPAFQPWQAVPDNKTALRYDTLEALKGNAAYVFDAVQPPTLETLFNPAQSPVLGQFSALAPSSLKPGMFNLLQNVRFDDTTLQARYPTTTVSTTGFSTSAGIQRGFWTGKLNGTQYIFSALYDGTKTAIWASTNGTTFTEVSSTSSSNAYGDTRFPTQANRVVFQPITNPIDSKDYLIIQNGTDTPLVYSTTALNGQNIFLINSIGAPVSSQNFAPQLSAIATCNLVSGVTTATTGTSFNVFGYNAYATGDPKFVYWNYGSDTATDTATVTLSASVSFANATQICFGTGQNQVNYPGCLLHYKIEFYDAVGGWQTLYDPTSGSNPANWYEYFGNTAPVAGVSLLFNQYVLSTIDISAISAGNKSAVSKFRFTVMTSQTTNSGNIGILAIFGGTATGAWAQASYQVNNTTGSYLLAYANSATHTESPGVVLPAVSSVGQPLWSSLGGQTFPSTTTYGPLYAPLSTKVKFAVSVPYLNPSSGDLANGVDTLNVYREDYGSNNYLYAFSVSLGAWNTPTPNVWNYVNTGNAAGVPYYALDTVTALNIAITRFAPDAYSLPLQTGSCMGAANGRSFVGNGSTVYISEYGNPFRFRQQINVVNNAPVTWSAAVVSLNNESAVGFATASASALSSATVFLFTSTNTYSFSGFDAYSLSQPSLMAAIGCAANGSIQVYRDSIFFLDNYGFLRKFAYTNSTIFYYSNANSYQLMQAISRRVVDDVVTTIPVTRLPYIASAVFNDRYYMALTPNGGSDNTQVLIFDDYVAGFVQDTVTSFQGFGVWLNTSNNAYQLLGQGSNGAVYIHEDKWTGSGTVTVSVTFPEIQQGFWQNAMYGRFGLVADTQSGQAATITKTIKPNQSDTSTIDMSTNATNQVWRWDHRTDAAGNPTPAGQQGVSCLVNLSIPMTGGTRIYSAVIEKQPAQPGADS